MKLVWNLNTMHLLGIFLLNGLNVLGQDTTKYAFVRAHILRGDLMIQKPENVTKFRELFEKKITEMGYKVINSNHLFEEVAKKDYNKFTFWDIFYQQELGSYPQTSVIVRDISGKQLYSNLKKKRLFVTRNGAYCANTNKLIKELPSHLRINSLNGTEPVIENAPCRFIFGNQKLAEYIDLGLPIFHLRTKLKKEDLKVAFTVNEWGLVSEVLINDKLASFLTISEKSQIAQYFLELPVWTPKYEKGRRLAYQIIYTKTWKK